MRRIAPYLVIAGIVVAVAAGLYALTSATSPEEDRSEVIARAQADVDWQQQRIDSGRLSDVQQVAAKVGLADSQLRLERAQDASDGDWRESKVWFPPLMALMVGAILTVIWVTASHDDDPEWEVRYSTAPRRTGD